MIARLASALSSHALPSAHAAVPLASAALTVQWRSITDSARSAPPFASRCRFVDLPEVRAKGCVGEADSFGSHCWGATWGHLVASLADEADPNRRVWIDVFAVRQWP